MYNKVGIIYSVFFQDYSNNFIGASFIQEQKEGTVSVFLLIIKDIVN